MVEPIESEHFEFYAPGSEEVKIRANNNNDKKITNHHNSYIFQL